MFSSVLEEVLRVFLKHRNHGEYIQYEGVMQVAHSVNMNSKDDEVYISASVNVKYSIFLSAVRFSVIWRILVICNCTA